MAAESSAKSIPEVAAAVGLYPVEAYLFVQHGLGQTVGAVHGDRADDPDRDPDDESFHISGRQLCEGLRAYAQERWGLMARTVLARWGVTSTLDLGRIVFAMIEHDLLKKTDRDSLEDFRGVFDFRTLEADYHIPSEPAAAEANV